MKDAVLDRIAFFLLGRRVPEFVKDWAGERAIQWLTRDAEENYPW